METVALAFFVIILALIGTAWASWLIGIGLLLLLLAGETILIVSDPQSLSPLLPAPALHGWTLAVALWSAFVLAAAGGATLAWHVRAAGLAPNQQLASGSMPSSDSGAGLLEGLTRRHLFFAVGAMFGVCLLLGLLGVALGETSVPRAVLLAVFSVTTVVTLLMTIDALRFEPLELQSSWGGLGGGLGGWRLSRSAVLLLVSVAFAGAAVVVGIPPAKPDAKPQAVEAIDRSITLSLHSATTKAAPENRGAASGSGTPTPPSGG